MKILAKNLMILASAGSGKTYQLSNRVIGLVSAGVDPRTIVALTFTRKAAGEFADEILMKLAKAAREEEAAEELRAATGVREADYGACLREVVRSLPEMTLGTLDSFFARIVRGFQYELGMTGGSFELVEGAAQAAAVDEILAAILRDSLGGEEGREFLHAFRRATAGREEQRIIDLLREFVQHWHGFWRDGITEECWGPEELLGEGGSEGWEGVKAKVIGPLREALEGRSYPDKRQGKAMEALVDALEKHTSGSGVLGTATGLFGKVVGEVLASEDGPLRLSYYKEFEVGGRVAELLRIAVRAAARGELAMALERTRAVAEIVRVFDRECEMRLRRRGRLGFDDVKRLMGEWIGSEEARLRREAVDFRLDARYEHWLLDEFQDTSRGEWRGIMPLLDEAVSGEGSSLFLVGDKKQGIYGWRGGEVGLFDEARERYGDGMELATMPVSWRSSPEVLSLVNLVCGDVQTMADLFGAGPVARWDWEEHVSAPPLQAAAKRGEARVEVVAGKRPERLARMVEVMRELGVGERGLTCGVLVRTNTELLEVADLLRAEGYDVVEEGRRAPASDNPCGRAVRGLVEWLAQPGNRHARGVLEMSPLGAVVVERFGGAWQAQWEGLLGRAEEVGLAGMVEEVVEPLWDGWSSFARRRVGDVLAALSELDGARATVAEAARLLGDLEVSQAPGIAAVQVMTIHKAKGLGFDVVLLPEIPDHQVPDRGHFRTARGKGWVTEVPADWACRFVPALVAEEEAWAGKQRYEAFCLLYVALTRAKRGLYVFTSPAPESRNEADEWASLANWVRRSCGGEGAVGVIYAVGGLDWIGTVPLAGKKAERSAEPVLGAAVERRERRSPSGRKDALGQPVPGGKGRAFGVEVHRLFEGVGWLAEGAEPAIPEGALEGAAAAVRRCLAEPAIRDLFVPRSGVSLYREQPFELLVDGCWMSGVVDRLHVTREADGTVSTCEVIDFKTDAVEKAEDLAERYAAQLEDYRRSLQDLFMLEAEKVRCVLVSTHLAARWELPPAG